MDIKTISERLGHKDISTTLRIYAHVIPNKQKEIAQKTDDLIANISPTHTPSEATEGK